MTITQSQLKYYLNYHPETGIFTWKVSHGNQVRIGKRAGSIQYKGQKDENGKRKHRYRVIVLRGKHYQEHCLAFLYMTGSIPAFIDHRDLSSTNNVWSNLRPATMVQNNVNRRVRMDSGSGVKGVHYDSRRKTNPWRASIKVNKKYVYLGSFATKEDASAAYLAKAQQLHGEFARA